MIISKKSSLFFFFLLGVGFLWSQDEVRDRPFISVGSHLGLDLPAGDLSDRFGMNLHAGLSLRLFTRKQKGFLAIEGIAHYGSAVKEDVLAPLRLESGAILGIEERPAEVFLRRRGAYIGIYANKIIVSSKDNPYAGLAVGIGLGILQHNIKFLDETNTAPHISSDYAKGYDRNTRGPALKQTLSYEHIGKNQSLNYSLGISIIEGFTKSIRAVNFDTGLSDTSSRLDLMIGIEATWYLPIKDFNGKQEIFY